jgi:hypothetical protein
VSWWVPFAFAGAALAGLVIALSLTSGRPRHDAAAAEPVHAHGAGRKSRFRQDNELVWNPAAFLTAVGLLGIVVLIAVLVEVL